VESEYGSYYESGESEYDEEEFSHREGEDNMNL